MRALWPSSTLFWQAAGQLWSSRIRLEHLIWASTTNIAALYVFGMIPLTGIEKSFTITDFWRWWVVHLWVEQSFEFFAACMSAYLLMAVGLVSRKLAERAVYFELILIFLGGVIGTGHHLYWAGGPSLWVPMGSMFSFIEVLPLVLLMIEAINHYRLIRVHQTFQYRLAYTYIIGAFGLLAIGLIYFCLRYIAADRYHFGEKAGLRAFWLYNAGLVLWIFLNFFPVGWPQLDAVFEHGFAYARSLEFYDTTLLWQWMRLPGDVVFAVAVVLMTWDFLIKLRPVLPRFAIALIPGRAIWEGEVGSPS